MCLDPEAKFVIVTKQILKIPFNFPRITWCLENAGCLTIVLNGMNLEHQISG
jgi:hypothetical protein